MPGFVFSDEIINDNLFKIPGNIKLHCIRNYLDIDQLNRLSMTEDMCINKLNIYMAENIEYHEIYKLLKSDIKQFAELMGKSTVDALEMPKNLITCQDHE